MMCKGTLLALNGKASDASPNNQIWDHRHGGRRDQLVAAACAFSYLARAYAALRQFDEASRCIGEACLDSKKQAKGGMRPRSIASPGKSH